PNRHTPATGASRATGRTGAVQYRQPRRERLRVVGIEVIVPKAEALLAEVEVDLVEPGLVPARIPGLGPAPREVVVELVHVGHERVHRVGNADREGAAALEDSPPVPQNLLDHARVGELLEAALGVDLAA